jgi:predicted negative regulator of RcsB-dependent stress response
MSARNKGLLWGIILGILALFGWQKMRMAA